MLNTISLYSVHGFKKAAELFKIFLKCKKALLILYFLIPHCNAVINVFAYGYLGTTIVK
jgi:hypothetical protein